VFFYEKQNKTESLLIEIVQKRQKMMLVAQEKGFTSDEAIKCSQELDELLNIYQQVLAEREEQKGFFSFLVKPFAIQKMG
jgi:stage 0 sporulation regulatory protein